MAAKSLDIPPHMQTAASLPEETLHPLEDILVLDRFGMLETGLLRQLFDQPLLLGTELRGDRDVDHDQFVAAAIAVDVGQPLAAQAQHLAGMRSRGDLDLGTAIDRRHLDRTAQQGCRNGDIEVVDQVVAVTHQLGIGLLFDHDLQVAVDASVTGGITLARDGEHHPLAHAGRDSDLHDLLTAEGSLALALVAGCGDDFARTAARGADALRLHTAEEGVLHTRHITRTVAGRTGRVGVAVLGPRTAALIAGDGLVYLEFLGDAVGDLCEGQPDLDADIRSPVHAPPAAR